MLRNSATTWGTLSRALHWVLGIAIIGMLAYGWWMNHMVPKPDRLFHRSIHADIGYVVLLLMVVRLIWRGVNPVPALPDGTRAWERALARINLWALYLTTIVVALLGWAHSGAHKPDYADWFGLFRVPQFTSENRDNAHFFEDWHIWIAYVLIGLVVLHLLAALYHRVIKRDRVVARMVTGE
jgi:cytochrome b561